MLGRLEIARCRKTTQQPIPNRQQPVLWVLGIGSWVFWSRVRDAWSPGNRALPQNHPAANTQPPTAGFMGIGYWQLGILEPGARCSVARKSLVAANPPSTQCPTANSRFYGYWVLAVGYFGAGCEMLGRLEIARCRRVAQQPMPNRQYPLSCMLVRMSRKLFLASLLAAAAMVGYQFMKTT